MESIRHILQWCIYVVVTYQILTISLVAAANSAMDELKTPDYNYGSPYSPYQSPFQSPFQSPYMSPYMMVDDGIPYRVRPAPSYPHTFFQEPTAASFFGNVPYFPPMPQQMPRQMPRQAPRQMPRQLQSLCAVKSCMVGSVCRVLQACTTCPPQAVCVAQSRSVAATADQHCQNSGYSQAVLLGSSMSSRPMRCVPWLQSMPRGGCAPGAQCVSGLRQAGTLAAGMCCLGQSSAPRPLPASYNPSPPVKPMSPFMAPPMAPVAPPMSPMAPVATPMSPPMAPMAPPMAPMAPPMAPMAPPMAPMTPPMAPMNPTAPMPSQPPVQPSAPATTLGAVPISTLEPFLTMQKVGACPVVSQALPSSCGMPCRGDPECPDDLKCCPSACSGRSCKRPTL